GGERVEILAGANALDERLGAGARLLVGLARFRRDQDMAGGPLLLAAELGAAALVVVAQRLLVDLDLLREIGPAKLDVLDRRGLVGHVTVAELLVMRRDLLVRDLDSVEERA